MITAFCWLTALPHLLYGPGEAALSLTTEYGATYDANQTAEVMEAQKAKILCRTNGMSWCKTLKRLSRLI